MEEEEKIDEEGIEEKKERAKELIEKLKALTETERKEGEIEKIAKILEGKGKGEVLDRIIEYYAMHKLLTGITGETKKDEFGDLLKYAIIRDALRPQIDPSQLIALTQLSKSEKSDSEIVKLMLQMQQQQMSQNQQLLTMFFGSRLQQFEQQLQTQQSDLINRLQSLESRLSVAPSLDEELERYVKFRETMLKFAEQEGLTKEQITTEKGQINWGTFLNRILKVAEKGIDTLTKRPPAFKEVREIPTQQIQPIVQPQTTVTQPAVTELPTVYKVEEPKIEHGETTSEAIGEQKPSEEIH